MPGKGGKSKKVGPFPGWNVLNGISPFIYTFLVLYTRYNCHQLGSHLGVPKKNQGMESCVSSFLNSPPIVYNVWKSLIWIVTFQRAAKRRRLQLADNIQSVGSFSVSDTLVQEWRCKIYFNRNEFDSARAQRLAALVRRRFAWDQAPLWGKKEKKIVVGEKKNFGDRCEPGGSLGRGNSGEAWRHASDAADPPSSNQLVIHHFDIDHNTPCLPPPPPPNFS